MKLLTFIASLVLLMLSISYACTNLGFSYQDEHLVARNFDWINNHTALVINPKGKKRQTTQLSHGEKPLKWTANYGSVTFDMTAPDGSVAYDAVVGGMNQKGLVASVLVLDQAKFQQPSSRLPNINSSYLAQYWLDNYATVFQAVQALKHLHVVATLWRGKPVTIHYVLRDAQGNTAIVEYLQSKPHIYLGKNKSHDVLTNSSVKQGMKLSQHLYLTNNTLKPLLRYSSEARYIRAMKFLQHMPAPKSREQAIGYGFAALQDVAEPPGTPWPTVWSVVYNTKTLKLFYRMLSDPRIRTVALGALPFKRECTFPLSAVKLRVTHC